MAEKSGQHIEQALKILLVRLHDGGTDTGFHLRPFQVQNNRRMGPPTATATASVAVWAVAWASAKPLAAVRATSGLLLVTPLIMFAS
jgi:hypothetical protein